MKTTIETLKSLAKDITSGNENYESAKKHGKTEEAAFYATWTKNKVKSFNMIEKAAVARGEAVDFE